MLKVSKAFTIIELVIVVVVIAILASIMIVSYRGIVGQARETAIKSDLLTAQTAVQIYKNKNNSLPTSLVDVNIYDTDNTKFSYLTDSQSFCISAQTASGDFQKNVVNDGKINIGPCLPFQPPPNIANCFIRTGGVIEGYYTNELGDPSKPACPTDVVIPATISGVAMVEAADNSFAGMNLTSVVFPNGFERIGNSAFADNELVTATIPNSVTWIGDEAFMRNNLTTVKINASSVWANPFDPGVVITYYQAYLSSAFFDKVILLNFYLTFVCHAKNMAEQENQLQTIIHLIGDVRTEIFQLSSRVVGLEQGIASLRTEFKGEIASVRQEIADLQDKTDNHEVRIVKLETKRFILMKT